MRRRPAITLIEVLVAILIMAIGLLALLTLFPLGALRMATALQDERDASSASAGANICDAFDLRHDPQYDPPVAASSLFLTPPPNGYNYPPASQVGAGIPIYVDPWGFAGGLPNNVGNGFNATTPTPPTPGLWRVSPSAAKMRLPSSGASLAARYFTLPDDMTFFTNGLPDTGTPPGSTAIQRAGRYTWAYLLKRPQPGSISSPVDLTVVVYVGRPPTLPLSAESTYAAAGLSNDTLVTVTHPLNTPPNIRRGTWILDTTYNQTTGSVNGDFYRVVSITTVDASHVNLELQTPISKPLPLTAITVMDNVSEVFFRGIGDSSQWEFHAQP